MNAATMPAPPEPKLGSELLFPLSGAPIWELVERGGSFAAPWRWAC